MNKKIIMGASVLAVIAAFPAFAETKVQGEATTGQKVEKTLERAGESIDRTTEKAGAAVADAYKDVKAYFNSDSADVVAVNINTSLTADELIGKTVQNAAGENIGEIRDILITADGDAEKIVISDSVLGLGGKLAVFDYDVLEGFTADDNAFVRLSEEQVKAAKRFEYSQKDAGNDANATVMPADHFSVAKIMDSRVYDATGKAVADVDTVAFNGDDAEYVVVTFNKILGIGGDKAALNLDAIDIQPRDDKYAFVLTQQQSAQFDVAKKGAKSN